MGKETGIEWTDHTFNPWWGCSRVSPGCAHCYAEAYDKRLGGALWKPGAERRTFGGKHWAGPRGWNEAAGRAKRRARVFCASMADVFDSEGPALERARLWELIRETPNLDWQLLTKRPHNIASMLPSDWGDGWSNVWLGTTVENQEQVGRVRLLSEVPAAVRFLSVEPLLGSVRLGLAIQHVRWVIVGGESGPHARPMRADWVRALRDEVVGAGVAFFFKQWGTWRNNPLAEEPCVGITPAEHVANSDPVGKGGSLLDGQSWKDFPTPAARPRQVALL